MAHDVTPGGLVADDRAEYERRLVAVRAAMSRAGFDAIVAVDSGDWLPPTGNARYLSNFNIGNMVNVMSGVAVVVPLREEPTLVVPRGPLGCFAEWARATAWIARIQSSPTTGGPLGQALDGDVVIALKESGLERARIGLCGAFPGSSDLASQLPFADIAPAVDVDGGGTARDLMDRVRRVKSPWEIERLRQAQRCTDVAITTFMRGVEPGRRHTACAAEADAASIEAGAEQALTIMNCGTDPWMWWHIQGGRRFSAHNVVSLETNARVDGYVAQIARSGVLGQENNSQRALREVATDSLRAMVERVRPGVTGGDLWRAGEAVVRNAGLRPWGRLGHGMGLSMDEGFGIVPDDDYALQENVCLAIHASVWNPETHESYLLGEQYLVKNGGAEVLSDNLPPHDLAPSLRVV